MRKKIILTAILLPIIALVFVFGFSETALGRTLDYNAFLESLNANGFEFEEAGFFYVDNRFAGGKVVYVGGERLIVSGQGVVYPNGNVVAIQITWVSEVSWSNPSLGVRVIYSGEDERIITFLNETFRPANDTIVNVTIDGEPVNFPDQAPVIVDGRTLVPVRGVFEELNFYVGWDESTKTVTLRRIRSISGNSPDMLLRFTEEVFITIGSDVFQYDSTLIYAPQNHVLDVPAQIINGRTMLPIRALVESIGYSVEWDSATQTVLITTGADSCDLHLREGFRRWMYENNYSTKPLDYISVRRHYGTFSGHEVVEMSVRDMGFDDAELYKRVAGYSFIFPNMGFYHRPRSGGFYLYRSSHIWAYIYGEFMCFSQAYEEGYLTAEDIRGIWQQRR
jgi:hypothetical protein